MADHQLKYVGANTRRVDGHDKVTGRAKYTGDLEIPGMLYGHVLRSHHAHARIVSIDASAAERLPGVAGVLTGRDVDDLDPHYGGRPLIALERVRYVGEPVAVVAADDPLTAEQAAALVQVTYEELPAAVGLDAALAPDAARVHEDREGNICAHEKVRRGDISQGFAESDRIFEHHFTFPMIYHYSMEPHGVIADYRDDGITLWSSAQHPFLVQADLARIFGFPDSKVSLNVPYLGGGFGGKSYAKIEPLVVAASRKVKRPVRVCLSVSEAMVTVRRHSAKVRVKTGVKDDGTIMAREAEIYLDTGAYMDNGPQVATRAATRVLGPYRIPHIHTDAYAVYTHAGGAGSFRSIGGPQSIFAGESQVNMIAASLGMDPAELRLKNLLKRGEELRPGLRPLDVNLAGTLKRLVSASRWKARSRKAGAPVGLACGMTNAGGQPITVAMVRLQADGAATIMAGSTEMGQGVRTVLSQFVGEELQLPLERIRMSGADTAITPYDRSTGSSRSTTLMGRAVQQAARDVKRQLLKIGAAAFGVPAKEIRLMDGALLCGEARMSFAEALEKRFGAAAGELIGTGTVGPEIINDVLPVVWEVGMGTVELDIDRDTGAVSVTDYLSVADVGKAINPIQCEGQEEGAAMMGLGHALFEEMIYEGGQLVNSNLVDYRIPSFTDMPRGFHTVLVENGDGLGPYGSRGMGEGGIFSVAPAITGALTHATGVQFCDLPLTPERVWRALRSAGGTDGA
ncbi:MAG: xanthine dehydrogenase family protein molybdopterin-binding subunit [Deltaproteobacteria bacterium]|nr:xanthine dehydrogenase family protein molybdopterin-binding subunit [Deltaproteobacteria bacterium]